MKIPKKAEPLVRRLQQLQQQLDVLTVQKQTIQIQLADVENALREIELSPESDVYEIIGNIMIKKERARAIDSLTEKKRTLKLREEMLEKQIRKITEESKTIQKEILKYAGEESGGKGGKAPGRGDKR
ncbi:MAG TPA: prefoldin subunit beta [Candidatus Aenigmarchaeota archaeon]|nr:prefoldin subunit beta [Candidatus Aenigmarchaeota archaeon]